MYSKPVSFGMIQFELQRTRKNDPNKMWGFLLFTHSDDTRQCSYYVWISQSPYFVYPFPHKWVKWVGFVCVWISWQQQWNNKTSVASQHLYWFWAIHIQWQINKWIWCFKGEEHGKIGGFLWHYERTKTNILMVWSRSINEPHDYEPCP